MLRSREISVSLRDLLITPISLKGTYVFTRVTWKECTFLRRSWLPVGRVLDPRVLCQAKVRFTNQKKRRRQDRPTAGPPYPPLVLKMAQVKARIWPWLSDLCPAMSPPAFSFALPEETLQGQKVERTQTSILHRFWGPWITIHLPNDFKSCTINSVHLRNGTLSI